MASQLDIWLGRLIPIGIILLFAAIFYIKLKEPIQQIGRWIKGLFSAGAEAVSGEIQERNIVYK